MARCLPGVASAVPETVDCRTSWLGVRMSQAAWMGSAHAATLAPGQAWSRLMSWHRCRARGGPGRHVGPYLLVPVPLRRSLRGALVRVRMPRSARRSQPHHLRRRRRRPRHRPGGRPVSCCGGLPPQADRPGRQESGERMPPSHRLDAPRRPRLHARHSDRLQLRVRAGSPGEQDLGDAPGRAGQRQARGASGDVAGCWAARAGPRRPVAVSRCPPARPGTSRGHP
jgi:hypothetical protein